MKSECKVCKGKGYHKLSCPNNDKKPIKEKKEIIEFKDEEEIVRKKKIKTF